MDVEGSHVLSFLFFTLKHVLLVFAAYIGPVFKVVGV
jgi:hypothetical protein